MSVEKNNQNTDKQPKVSLDTKDYFKSLEESILAKTMGTGYHLPLGVKHPFVAPSGYFEALETEIKTIVSSNSFQLTPNISHPFTAPEGYFAALETKILQLTATTSAYQLAENIGHPFTAPKGYFESLDAKIYQKTITTKPSSPFKKVWKNYGAFIRLAAALILVGSVGLGVYKNSVSSAPEELTLAELNSDAILSYLEDENFIMDDFSELDAPVEINTIDNPNVDNLSEEELLQLIDFQFTDEI